MLKSLYTIIILALAVLPCAAQEAVVDSMAVDSAFSASNTEFPAKKAVVAASPKKRSYWDHGFGKFLVKIDRFLEEGQLSGIDTTYQTIPKLNRQVYLGAYGYWQNYSNLIPFYFPESINKRIPGLRDGAYYKINAHTQQAAMELG
ncbi:MAG TPA: hypothetical protein DCQ91_03375, partial [Porphyromonadaceae bacterium]|nr:hypothetical protein [Porphyromonadaceae bacterium]